MFIFYFLYKETNLKLTFSFMDFWRTTYAETINVVYAEEMANIINELLNINEETLFKVMRWMAPKKEVC